MFSSAEYVLIQHTPTPKNIQKTLDIRSNADILNVKIALHYLEDMVMKKNVKADEMEVAINFKAMRIAFIFSTLALTVYCCLETFLSGALPTVPCIIWLSQGSLFFCAKFIFTKIATVQSDEE